MCIIQCLIDAPKKYRFQIPWCKCNYKSRWKKLQYYIWHCVFISMSFLTHFPDSRIHPKFYCPTISPTAFPTKNLNLILQAARCARRCEPPSHESSSGFPLASHDSLHQRCRALGMESHPGGQMAVSENSVLYILYIPPNGYFLMGIIWDNMGW